MLLDVHKMRHFHLDYRQRDEVRVKRSIYGPHCKIFSCIECAIGEQPNAALDKCFPIRAVYLEWSSPYAIFAVTFSALGLIATIFVVSVFIRFNNTPVVMASGRELSYVSEPLSAVNDALRR